MGKKRATRKPKVAPALTPQTAPADPERRHEPIVIVQRSAGVRVNEDTALTLGALWSCVRAIAETLAGLPWLVHRRRADRGWDIQVDHPINWLLDTQPNPETPAFQFRESIVAHALTWGNGYAEIERNMAGEPVWMWQLTPDRVQVERWRGRIIYDVWNDSGPNTQLEQDEVFHLRGLGFDGLTGYSVIRMFARTIGMGIALEDSASSLFANDATPGGVLKTPNKLSEKALENLERTWKTRHQGPSNRRNFAILEEGLEWQAVGLPPEDSQLVQQRQLTPAEICRIFRVPPHKIADLIRSTNNNIEHQEIEFVNDTLRPWAERLETEADIKLFGRNNRGKLVTILDLDELKRGDMAARTAYHSAMLDRGVFSINDVRRRENMNPIGADGDKRFVPLNMQLLENAGEEDPETPEMPVIESKDETDNADTPETSGDEKSEERMRRLSAGCELVMQDACRRISKRERDARKLSGDALTSWLAKHRDYCKDALAPVVGMLSSMHSDAPDIPASAALTAYVDGYIAEPIQERNPAQQAEKLRTMVLAACAATEQHEVKYACHEN